MNTECTLGLNVDINSNIHYWPDKNL